MSKTSGQLDNERIRARNLITITDLTTCYYCKSTGLKEDQNYCPNCAFPQNGTQAEMQTYIRNVYHKKTLLATHKKAINKSRIILYLLAGANFIFGFVAGLFINATIYFLISCISCSIIY